MDNTKKRIEPVTPSKVLFKEFRIVDKNVLAQILNSDQHWAVEVDWLTIKVEMDKVKNWSGLFLLLLANSDNEFGRDYKDWRHNYIEKWLIEKP